MTKYCLVGYLHSNMSRHSGNIIGGRLIDLKTLKFINVDNKKLNELLNSKECIGIRQDKEGVKENFYLYTNKKERFIPEFGEYDIIVGKAKNCYMVTDGKEYIRLVDIDDICEADSLCKIYSNNTINTKIYTCRDFYEVNNREIKYLDGSELLIFNNYQSGKTYKTTEINNKLITMDAGYYITSNLDVIVTNAKKLKVISDKGIIKTIGKYGGFRLCENLNTVRLGDNVKFIYDYAFYKCIRLKKVVLGKSVRYIGEQAFGFCESLEEVLIKDGVIQIASMAFGNCINLKKISIPKTVKQIGENAFVKCRSLNTITVFTDKHKMLLENYKHKGYINEHVDIVVEGKK